jgi:hypothetical protein
MGYWKSTNIVEGFKQTTGHYIPEDRTLHNHDCKNLKSYSTETDYWISEGHKLLTFNLSEIKYYHSLNSVNKYNQVWVGGMFIEQVVLHKTQYNLYTLHRLKVVI